MPPRLASHEAQRHAPAPDASRYLFALLLLAQSLGASRPTLRTALTTPWRMTLPTLESPAGLRLALASRPSPNTQRQADGSPPASRHGGCLPASVQHAPQAGLQ